MHVKRFAMASKPKSVDHQQPLGTHQALSHPRFVPLTARVKCALQRIHAQQVAVLFNLQGMRSHLRAAGYGNMPIIVR